MLTVTIFQIFTSAVLIIFGTSIWIQSRRDLQRFGFLLFCALLSLWIGFGVISNLETPEAELYNKIIFIFPLWIIYAAYYFINRLVAIRTGIETLFLLIVGTVSIGAVTTDLIVSGVIPIVSSSAIIGYNVVRGPLYPAYILLILLSAGLVLFHLAKLYLKADGMQKRQLSVIGVGLLTTLVIGLILAAAIPLITHSSESANYSFLSGLAAATGFSVAIARHGLFDIKLAVVRSVAYVLSLASLSAIYYVFAYFVSMALFKGETTTAVSISPINIALALALAFAFQPIKGFFDRATDKIFFRDRYNSDEFYARLSEVLTTTTDLHDLLERAAKEIGNTLKAENAFFFVQYNHTHHVTAGTKRGFTLPLEDVHYLNKYVERNGAAIIIAELLPRKNHIWRLMTSHAIAILMPLVREDRIVGYFALGNHNSGKYTDRDIKVLDTISDELLIAIQHALSVQEIKDINAHLEQRIEHATQQLRTTNARLVRIDETKDEFLNMASHQLRTPLTTVKGYLSMVLEGDAGKVSKKQDQLLSEAFASSERMVHLIHDFLNVSRLQTGKFALELGEYDLRKIIADEIGTLKTAARGRNIQIKFDDKAGSTMLTMDETKVHQVVMNFIDNAMYYTKPGGTITVHTQKHKNEVEVRVVDNGIGVPHAEQAHLFNKFFRATNARKQRPDGTGVGLYLAKKIVDAHHGEIIFESKEGKGSTFGFRLPLKNNRK